MAVPTCPCPALHPLIPKPGFITSSPLEIWKPDRKALRLKEGEEAHKRRGVPGGSAGVLSLSPCPSLALFARGIVGQAAGAAQPLQRCLPGDWALIPPGFPRAGSPPPPAPSITSGCVTGNAAAGMKTLRAGSLRGASLAAHNGEQITAQPPAPEHPGKAPVASFVPAELPALIR